MSGIQFSQQKRGLRKEFSRTPPLPKSEPPINDPPYEVIEFPSQQYSNTTSILRNKAEQKKEEVKRKCDLCGSSNAQYHCEMCVQQAFCASCDQMYHRHPKRQTHIRKRIPNVSRDSNDKQPPVPPKGEFTLAPIPPPRRNKRGNKTGLGISQQETTKKNGSIMGSLKRFVGGIQPSSSQLQLNKTMRSDSRPPKFSHNLNSMEFDQQSLRRDGGYLDRELENRHRSGSFATLNGPGFPPLIQAQSMAQLNCPSCHHHGMSAWDWNRSQMNLNFQQPWPGMSTGTWHGSVMFPPPYRMPVENFSDHSSRRGSIRHQRYNRRPSKFDNEDDTESELSLSDDRKSRRRSPPSSMRGASPALSRRSRRTMASDTDDDAISRKSDRRFKRRTVPVSRDPSPAVFKGRTYRKKYDDDDAVSMKSTSSRKSRKSPVNKPALSNAFLKRNTHSSSDDSDDELTSERDATGDKNTSNSTDETPNSKSITKISDVTKAAATHKTQVAQKIKNYEKLRINQSKSPPLKHPSQKSQDNEDWECEHCTYLNPASSRVCDVCCKSKKNENPKNEEMLVDSMKNLNVSPADGGEKKKGDESVANEKAVEVSKTSTGTSPPPQSAATQTYDVPVVVAKRNRSLSFDDYSDWNPNKKSSSAASFISDTQSIAGKSEKSHQSSDYKNLLLEKQMKDGLEIVKLLQDAEKHHFNTEDLTVALMHCGEMNPVMWLLENWNKMIDTVVTLATNYGHEQPENIIGTISSLEAKAALHLHSGDIWAAATECIKQRQRKYVKLMSKGNFTREDVVTVLTANHGDIEAAYMELRKSQLKPFLMKIWGPPLGLDNDSGNTFKLKDKEKYYNTEISKEPCMSKYHPSSNNFSSVQSWLKSVQPSCREDIDLIDFVKLKNNLRKYASAFYLNNTAEPMDSENSPMSDYSDSNEELYTPSISMNDQYLRYRSCDNLNIVNKPSKLGNYQKRFHKSSESLFYNGRKFDYLNNMRNEINNKFFLHRSDNEKYVGVEVDNSVEKDMKFENNFDNLSNVEKMSTHSIPLNVNEVPVNLKMNEIVENSHIKIDDSEEDVHSVIETDSLESAASVSQDLENDIENVENQEDVIEDHKNYVNDEKFNENDKGKNNSDFIPFLEQKKEKKLLEEEKIEKVEHTSLFYELKALYFLAKKNLEFFIISNNDASVEIEKDIFFNKKNLTNKIEISPLEKNDDEKIGAEKINNSPISDLSFQNDSLKINEEIKSNTQFSETSIPQTDTKDEHAPLFQSNLFDNNIFRETNRTADSDNEESSVDGIRDLENESFDSSSENIDEDLENEGEFEENSFHEALVDNIKEDIFNTHIEEVKNTNSENDDSAYKQIEKIKPINFNPCVKPAHIIRINVPDDLINAAKKNHDYDDDEANVTETLVKPTHTNNLSTSKNSLPKIENPETKKNSYIDKLSILDVKPETKVTSSNNDTQVNDEVQGSEIIFVDLKNEHVNFENKSTSKGKKVEDKLKQETTEPLPISNIQETFSEYVRDVVPKEKKISEEEKLPAPKQLQQNLQEDYLSDSSDNSFKIEVQKCISQGISNYDQAVLAAQLIKLKFDRSQSIDAALECSNIQTAITYLQQDCQLCAEKVSIKEMISMLECEHRCCQNCAEQFFTLQILEKSIVDCVCPFCKQPQISNLGSDEAFLYFSNLDILLKSILQPNIHELFQQKLRDRTLMQDPNFKWCSKCSSGFIAEPGQKRILCPDCKSVSCAQCGKLWDKEHDGKTCEQYNSWLSHNDSNSQLSRYLEDYGVTCPKCDTKFILVKGGCMHLTCSHCKYEFCSDCLKAFSMGTDCKISEYCAKLGLHAHHPRNCLFYLRDKEPQELKQLLKDNKVEVNLEQKENPRCNVQLQKETEDGLVDTRCGARVEEAGLCRTHFVEYLTALIRKNKIDPVVIFDLAEVLQEFRRRGKSLPIRPANMFEHEYRRLCIKIVKEEMPIE